jgi:cellulose synthase/poly-beta-1,6-N-acetylglucosamine synthase-like glycosyltransferase
MRDVLNSMHLFLLIVIVGSVFSVISTIFYIVNSYRSVRYRQPLNDNLYGPGDITIIVPVYKENPDFFDKVLSAVQSQGANVIVVGDGCTYPYSDIAARHSFMFLATPQRGGKRKALSLAMHYVQTQFVMFVDSDTILPPNAVKDLLSSFTDDVGGVGANLRIIEDGRVLSYASEFVERSREVILKAMNHNGHVMILDGGAAIYRTEIVKPFILSGEFYDYKVLGRKSVAGDDRQLTSHVIRSGYKAIKNYNVNVSTPSQKTLSSYYRQQVRWARNGWYYFFKDLFGGTAKKAGAFYTFELIYVYLLPIFFLGLSLTEVYFFLFTHHDSYYRFAFSHDFLYFLTTLFTLGFLRFTRFATTLVNGVSLLVFGAAIRNNMARNRLKTFAYGSVGLIIMFIATLHGLVTFWKQGSWLTR